MESTNGFAMAGGDGNQSYTKNSTYQRAVIDAANLLVQKCVSEHVNPTNSTFRIADLGCSVGPNTFIAVDNIIESVKLKHRNNTNDQIPEFQVYFSDQVLNDFNNLFKSLPPDREYYASGVPGSFHTRLFPRASLNIVHCSTALHWLSQLPREITDRNSRAYNRGRIFYLGADEEVTNAYSRQHEMDLSKFLDARGQELVPEGLVMLVLPARPNGVPHSRVVLSIIMDMLGECLMDLAREGVIDEEKVNEFNLPMYFASPQEVEQVINGNGRFNIERMEGLPEVKAEEHLPSPQHLSLSIRATTGELISKQFGHEILDHLFNTLLPKKFVIGADRIVSGSALSLFVLIKLKQN